MLHTRFLLVLLAFPALALADEPRTEASVIRSCLAKWPDNPFGNEDPPRYKVLGSKVSVFGVGGAVTDETKTTEPQLVLVKPAVNIMTKGRFQLMNPNGWYCFESAVTVMAKSEITVHCEAHLATSGDDVAVAGDNTNAGGVTVLGKAVVKRVGCTGEKKK